MDKQTKKLHRKKIGDLLDVCKSCPKRKHYLIPEVECSGCVNYREMRSLGKKLWGEEKRMAQGYPLDITPAEYLELASGIPDDKEIAEKLGVHKSTLNNWKLRNKKTLDLLIAGETKQADIKEKSSKKTISRKENKDDMKLIEQKLEEKSARLLELEKENAALSEENALLKKLVGLWSNK